MAYDMHRVTTSADLLGKSTSPEIYQVRVISSSPSDNPLALQNNDRGGTVAAPRRASQTGSAENPESISGTMLMNGDASGTLVMNSSNPSGTVMADQGRGGTLLVARGSDVPGGGLGTVAERGEDFAAALRSNAPAETSGYFLSGLASSLSKRHLVYISTGDLQGIHSSKLAFTFIYQRPKKVA